MSENNMSENEKNEATLRMVRNTLSRHYGYLWNAPYEPIDRIDAKSHERVIK